MMLDQLGAEQITLLMRNERELELRALRGEAEELRARVSKRPLNVGLDVVRECDAKQAVGR